MVTGKANIKFLKSKKSNISIMSIFDEFLKKGILIFQNTEVDAIGKSEKLKKMGAKVTMTFSNTENIDVLIERLSALKRAMNNNTKDYTSSDISYKEELDENPLPKVKTMLEKFIELFPNAEMNPDGCPEYCCPYFLGWDSKYEICDMWECIDCWNREYKGE